MNISTLIKRISLSILLIALFQSAYSQENYQPGYIVRSAGDTLHGFIDYRFWERNPDKISFKKTSSADKSLYTPLTILSFGVNNTTYQSAIVETEISPEIESGLDAFSDLKFKTDTAFLQIMIKGPKSLYYYNNKSSKAQFYIKNDSTYELLIHKTYIEENEGKSVQKENKKYIGQLIYYLRDVPSIQSKVSNIEYKTEDIENLFLLYYKNPKSGVYSGKAADKTVYETGISGGVSMTSLTFHSLPGVTDYIDITEAKYNRSAGLSGGLFLNMIFPMGRKRWSVNNELVYNSFKINGQFDGYNYENTTIYLTFDYSYIKIRNSLRYTYPIGKFSVSVNAGISNGYRLSEYNHRKFVQIINDHPIITEREAFLNTRKTESGYVLGTGVNYKKYSFELKYEKGFGMATRGYFGARTNSFFFLLGYKF